MKKFPYRYLVWVIALIPLLLLRDYTPDNELRYLSIADEALRGGHSFAFFTHGEMYADKPPLYLWIVMLFKTLFGRYSLPGLCLFSILPGLGVLYVMDLWVKRHVSDAEMRKSAQWMLVTTTYFIGCMSVLRMDMLLTFFVVTALYLFYRMYEDGCTPQRQWSFSIMVFLAIFTKGPFGIALPVSIIAVFLLCKHQIKTIGKYFGWRFWTLIVCLCGLWMLGVYLDGGYEYMHDLLFKQTTGRAFHAFVHRKPFYFYLTTFIYSAAPWSLLCLVVLVVAVIKKWICTDLELFFSVSFLTILVMLSCISSKLEVYLLPVYPFIIYLVFLLIPRWGKTKWCKGLFLFMAAVLVLAFPLVLVFINVCHSFCVYNIFPVWLAAGVLTVGGGCIMRELLKKQLDAGAFIRFYSMIILTGIFILSFSVPVFNYKLGYGELADKCRIISEKYHLEHYASYVLRRSGGMDVYLGCPMEEINHTQVRRLLSEDGGSTLVIIKQSTLKKEPDLVPRLRNHICYTFDRYHLVVCTKRIRK